MGVALYRAAIRLTGFSVLSSDQISRMVISAVLEQLCKKLLTTCGKHGVSNSDERHTNMSPVMQNTFIFEKFDFFFLSLHADAGIKRLVGC